MLLREYLSPSGSFSRSELVAAMAVLLAVGGVFAALRQVFPNVISEGGYNGLIYALYPIWGMALGKRSRDLGTTFSYGMIIGMIFPIIGVVFLFQPGEKFRKWTAERQARRQSVPPPLKVHDSNQAKPTP
jgi:drug/metabolite transporter (DMT)-like permease